MWRNSRDNRLKATIVLVSRRPCHVQCLRDWAAVIIVFEELEFRLLVFLTVKNIQISKACLFACASSSMTSKFKWHINSTGFQTWFSLKYFSHGYLARYPGYFVVHAVLDELVMYTAMLHALSYSLTPPQRYRFKTDRLIRVIRTRVAVCISENGKIGQYFRSIHTQYSTKRHLSKTSMYYCWSSHLQYSSRILLQVIF